ncbi:LuxR C-terminal-related transcriptional regulator [Paenibacillus macerans]|uniref:LuxR C-terminal-related transcriptional regulator n=1 Tax=Paenibacillus macerans TaxID=44252 RepID=UPI002E1A85F4|nr:LuxR C-terminal-related transcriptional regulator [Paenibacillus macerans]MED4954770.1 LuxR C-terminal-related transcriptional regulator [Paenibacillus macerans]
MNIPILTTKLHIPPARTKVVQRSHLFQRLSEGQQGKLMLISASAGYGKTTLVSEWLADCRRRAAWLSLDEGDNDPVRFLLHLIAAIKNIVDVNDQGVSKALQSPQPLPIEYILTILVNAISSGSDPFILVLDDYHVIESQTVHDALSFLIDHQPLQMHLIIMTREEPQLPIAKLRARNQLTELRGNDLCFTRQEAALFFNQIMGLNLSSDEVFSLEARTEGWVVGLQLAAISMQGCSNTAQFISSFTGSHRFVLDYLMEEVLMQQSEKVQTFLLHTSILDRFCGSLCDAVLPNGMGGDEILAYLERSNLFIIPLDSERHWYRYHHLFADLLRQRLYHANKDGAEEIAVLHTRASHWFEKNDLEIEAFQHAAAAQDVDRAATLIEGRGMPLHFRGAAQPVLNWLKRQDESTLNERPSLWVIYASALLMIGQVEGIEQKLSAAEAAMKHIDPDEADHDLIGHMASIRATLGVIRNETDTIIAQSLLALDHLHPNNLPVRAATTWTLGVAYQLQGDRAAARRAYTEALSISKRMGHLIITLMATLGTGQIQELNNQLNLAVRTYKQVIELAGEPPLPAACDAYLGMARIFYEWNDLEAAEQHIGQSILLAKQIENTDRLSDSELFAAKLKLARQDISASEALLTKARHEVQERSFTHLLGEVQHLELLISLHHGNFPEAVKHLETSEWPVLQSRIHMIQGNGRAALAILGTLYDQAKAKQWKNEQLKLLVLQALAFQVQGNMERALESLNDALTLAEKEGFVRLFVDEGKPMLDLLTEAATRRLQPDYTGFLLSNMHHEQKLNDFAVHSPPIRFEPLIDALSERELEVLQLIAQGLSNQEIGDRLFLALSTVKGYNRNIFDKLQVKRRTEAIARARELGLI